MIRIIYWSYNLTDQIWRPLIYKQPDQEFATIPPKIPHNTSIYAKYTFLTKPARLRAILPHNRHKGDVRAQRNSSCAVFVLIHTSAFLHRGCSCKKCRGDNSKDDVVNLHYLWWETRKIKHRCCLLMRQRGKLLQKQIGWTVSKGMRDFG